MVTRQCLAATGTTAAYDPSFMAGYAMSIVSDRSSTLPDAALFVAASVEPALAYKTLIVVAASAVPWLWIAAACVWRSGTDGDPGGADPVRGLFLERLPVRVRRGRHGRLPAPVPLGLATVAVVTAYLDRGGFWRWLASASACTVVFLVHLTSTYS